MSADIIPYDNDTKIADSSNINIYLATNKSISLTFASKMFIKYLKA
mgnify:CR=1 FL=1